MERENQRIAITKRLLKESMLKILKEKELDSINVTELCQEAGINRATFYRHYEIPRDVLVEIQQDLYHDLRQNVEMPKTSDDVRPFIRKLCAYMAEHLEQLRMMIRCNSDMDLGNFINGIYLEILMEYTHVDALKKLSREDLQILSLYSAGGSYFVFRSWIMGSIRKSPEEMADYVCELLNKTELLLMSTLPERSK